MWVAKQERESYQASIRRNGKFTDNSERALAAALLEWGWSTITEVISMRCRNRAAVRLLQGDVAEAERWIARSKAIRGIE